jgi:hypothetical protein
MSIQESSFFKASFHLHLRCHNCRKITGHMLAVPDVDDAPNDVEELMESQLLKQIPFRCAKCENTIASVVAIKPSRKNS